MSAAVLRIEGSEALYRFLGHMTDAAPRRALMNDIGAAMRTSTELRFDNQVGPDGQPWKPSQRAEAEGGLTLVDRGHLRRIDYQATADRVEWGSNLIYAAIHQFGGTIVPKAGEFLSFEGVHGFARVKSVTIPARPYLGINNADEREIDATLADWIAEGVQ